MVSPAAEISSPENTRGNFSARRPAVFPAPRLCGLETCTAEYDYAFTRDVSCSTHPDDRWLLPDEPREKRAARRCLPVRIFAPIGVDSGSLDNFASPEN